MPACFANNCSNRSEHGFRMFSFPRDEKRKHLWAEKCGKNPKQNCRLCEYHFDDSQFENRRQDGWRKLKPNAIPMIFNSKESNSNILNDPLSIEQQVQLKHCKIASNVNEEFGYNENVTTENPPSEQGFQLDPSAVHVSVQTDDEISVQKLQTKFMTTEEGTIRQANKIKYLLKHLEQERAKASAFKSKYENEKILRLKTMQTMKMYRNRYTILSGKLDKSPILKQFTLGFSQQQTKWPLQCLKLATQLRYVVGWKAYLYLKKDLGLPLPSYSTLCRYIKRSESEPGVLTNVYLLRPKKKKIYKSLHQTDCVILMDEMNIQPVLEHDVSTR